MSSTAYHINQVGHPGTSLSSEQLSMFGALSFLGTKLFGNSWVGCFLILSNLKLRLQANMSKLLRTGVVRKTSALSQKPSVCAFGTHTKAVFAVTHTKLYNSRHFSLGLENFRFCLKTASF